MNLWLNTSYACGLVAIDSNHIVIKICPIYKWMHGKSFDVCLHYLASKKQFIDLKVIGEKK